jgi:hypothetical protein
MPLKVLLLLTGLLALAGGLSAQARTEKYCLLNLSYALKHIDVTVETGMDNSLAIQDTALLSDLKRLKVSRYKSVVDVLNYMASKGWTLVTTSNMRTGSMEFYFKRQAD